MAIFAVVAPPPRVRVRGRALGPPHARARACGTRGARVCVRVSLARERVGRRRVLRVRKVCTLMRV